MNRSGVIRHRFRWTIGELDASAIGLVLPGRVPFGQSLIIKGSDHLVSLLPGNSNGLALEDGRLKITLDTRGAMALAEMLQQRRGEFNIQELPTLTVKVVPSEIRDRTGKVIDVIG